MTSEVEICNIALSNARAGSINSLDESSLQAQQCKLKYELLRDRALADGAWIFNHKIQPLALLTTEIVNWRLSYAYPPTCLKIRRMVPAWEEVNHDSDLLISTPVHGREGTGRHKIPYEVFNVEGVKVIGANEDDLRISFSAKITDPNLFSPDFTLALSYLIAAEIAMPLVGVAKGRAIRGDSYEIYNAYLASAASNDDNDGYIPAQESDFVNVRS